MSRKHARERVSARTTGYLSDPHRQHFHLGPIRKDMGKRRARKAMAIRYKQHRRRFLRLIHQRNHGTT
jgi:hypothetical protein